MVRNYHFYHFMGKLVHFEGLSSFLCLEIPDGIDFLHMTKKEIFNFPSFSLNWEPLYEYAFVNSCYVSNKCLTLPCFCASNILIIMTKKCIVQVHAFMHELEMLNYIYVIHVILMGWFNRRKKNEICFGTFSRVDMMLMIIVFFCFVGQWGRKVGHWAGCRCWRG